MIITIETNGHFVNLIHTSPTDNACFGKEQRWGPSIFQTSFNTTRLLSWNNKDDFNSLTRASTDNVCKAADLIRDKHYIYI